MSNDATKKAKVNTRLECVDCRKGMLEVASQSVSLILTDPPYFLDGMDDNWDTERIRSRMKKGVVTCR